MKVSVIIPSYNCETTIETTVQSILDAQLPDIEIILVDDGSSDRTLELCQKLQRQYDVIKVIHQENQGVSAARNRGLQEATGEYIQFFDSDDTADSKELFNVVTEVEKSKPDMAIYGMSFDYYHKGIYYRNQILAAEAPALLTPDIWSKKLDYLYRINYLSSSCNKLFRHEVLNNSTRFNEHVIVMEDFLFCLESLVEMDTIQLFTNIVYHYKQAENDYKLNRRMTKINSLTQYMLPFENALDSLSDRFNDELVRKENRILLYNVFWMLLRQKTQHASCSEIRKVAEDLKDSKYALMTEEYSKKDTLLCKRLCSGHIIRIWMQYRIMYLRRRVAKRVKKLLKIMLQRKKYG